MKMHTNWMIEQYNEIKTINIIHLSKFMHKNEMLKKLKSTGACNVVQRSCKEL